MRFRNEIFCFNSVLAKKLSWNIKIFNKYYLVISVLLLCRCILPQSLVWFTDQDLVMFTRHHWNRWNVLDFDWHAEFLVRVRNKHPHFIEIIQHYSWILVVINSWLSLDAYTVIFWVKNHLLCSIKDSHLQLATGLNDLSIVHFILKVFWKFEWVWERGLLIHIEIFVHFIQNF